MKSLQNKKAQIPQPRKCRSGYTLIETLTIVAILSILLLIASSYFTGYARKAKIAQAIHDSRVIEDAFGRYLDENHSIGEEVLSLPVTAEFLDAIAKSGSLVEKEGLVPQVGDGIYYEVPESFIERTLRVKRHAKDKVYLNQGEFIYIDIDNSGFIPEEKNPGPTPPEQDEDNLDLDVCSLIPADARYFSVDAQGFITNFYQDAQGQLPLLYEVNIPSVIDGLTVKGIRKDVFRDKEITGVCIPNSVEHIEEYAFRNNNIKKVFLPDNLYTLGPGAFSYNVSLKEVVVTSNIIETVSADNYVAMGPFYKASLGDKITLTDNVTYVPKKLFADAGVTSIDLNNVITIDRAAFEHNQIAELDLKKATLINHYAFASNQIGTFFWGDAVRIEEEAFARNRFTALKVSEKIEYLGIGAFMENTGLESVEITHNFDTHTNVFVGNKGVFAFANLENRIVIGPEVSRIPHKLFYKANVTDIDLNNVEIVEGAAFENNTSLSHVDLKKVLFVGELAFANSGIEAVYLRNVEHIGELAFAYNRLEQVNLPVSLTHLGNWAFRRNSVNEVKTLKTVIMNSNIQSMGFNPFEGSIIENRLVLDESVTKIPVTMFAWSGITEVNLHEGITHIETSAFEGNRLTQLHLPSSLVRVDSLGFANNLLNSTNLNKVIQIGDGAFRDNRITAVSIPDTVSHIGNRAFHNNTINGVPTIQSVKIHANIPSSGGNVFSGAALGDRVILDESVTFIPEGLFSWSGITDIGFLHNNVGIIKREAFMGNKIKNIVFPDSVSVIGVEAFRDNQLESVTFTGFIKEIGHSAFRGNTNLSSLTFFNYPVETENAFPYPINYVDAGTYTLVNSTYKK